MRAPEREPLIASFRAAPKANATSAMQRFLFFLHLLPPPLPFFLFFLFSFFFLSLFFLSHTLARSRSLIVVVDVADVVLILDY